MTNPHHYHATVDLNEVNNRNETAHRILAGLASTAPSLAVFWQYLETALTDTVILTAEVSRLSAERTAARLDAANLLAAMRATIAADADGDADPLWYLRDELAARHTPSQDHGWAS